MANTFTVQRSSIGNAPGDAVVLALQGFLDAHTAPEFEKAIQQEIDGGHVRLIADCGGLTYISSAGLGVFMSFIEDLRAAEGDLKICCLTPKVEQVFELLGFGSIFEMLPAVDDAARSFADAKGV